jgi:DNA-binding NarL/FixJ family response regulator
MGGVVTVRLALIEDHAALRMGLELLLRREGCRVVATAGDRETGLAVVREHEPDVVLIDVGLGADSGIELTRELLGEDRSRRVVLYTGRTELDVLLDGLDAGARGIALKAGVFGELLEAIQVVADGGSYMDPRLRPSLQGRPAEDRPGPLSARELEIIALLAQGLTGDEVAERLFLSTETVKTHVRNAVGKIGARNRVHAIAIALSEGLITLDRGQVGSR